MHLLVDPVVLCFPTDMRAAEPIEEFLGYINRWEQFIFHDRRRRCYISERCEEALHDERCLLNPELVRLRFQHFGDQFDHLGAGATNRACVTILQRLIPWPSLRATVSYHSITLTPDLWTGILKPSIVDSLQDTLAYVAWAQATGKDERASNLNLFTHPIPEHKDIRIEVNLKSGKTVTGKLPIKYP